MFICKWYQIREGLHAFYIARSEISDSGQSGTKLNAISHWVMDSTFPHCFMNDPTVNCFFRSSCLFSASVRKTVRFSLSSFLVLLFSDLKNNHFWFSFGLCWRTRSAGSICIQIFVGIPRNGVCAHSKIHSRSRQNIRNYHATTASLWFAQCTVTSIISPDKHVGLVL